MNKYLLSLLLLAVSSLCVLPAHAVAAAEKGSAQDSKSTAGQKSPIGEMRGAAPLVKEIDLEPVLQEEEKTPEPAGTQGLLKVEEIDEPLERLESQEQAFPTPSPEPEPKSPATNTSPDSLIESAEVALGKIPVTELKVENVSIEIHAEERIEDYKIYTLTGPSRLVIEISNAVFRPGTNNMVINKFGISTARFEQHPKFLRIFLDAVYGRIIPYRIEETDASLNIILTNF